MREFLSSLSVSEMVEKTLKVIHAQVALPPQIRMKIWKIRRWLTIHRIAETVGIGKEIKKRCELWKNKSWVFYQDYAPTHSELSFKSF